MKAKFVSFSGLFKGIKVQLYENVVSFCCTELNKLRMCFLSFYLWKMFTALIFVNQIFRGKPKCICMFKFPNRKDKIRKRANWSFRFSFHVKLFYLFNAHVHYSLNKSHFVPNGVNVMSWMSLQFIPLNLCYIDAQRSQKLYHVEV